MKERIRDTTWDFRTGDTKEYSHGIHSYPAMMIPQIARRLIKEYGENAEILLDPYVGSGSVIIEGMLHPSIKEIYGIEINPLGILISKVKTTPLDLDKLTKGIKNLKNRINKDITKYNFKSLKVNSHDFTNIDFWFNKEIKNSLTIIKNNISKIKNKDTRDFFFVCFSEIVRTVSYTRNSEFKLYRMDEESMKKHKPNVKQLFFQKIDNNVEKLTKFINEYKQLKKNTMVHILPEDTRYKTSIPDNIVDILVTSPPYGDSRTTVAYGQFSRLSSQWLGYDDTIVKNVDQQGLGGIKLKNLDNNLPSDVLKKTIDLIAKQDVERAKEVLSFYVDFDKCVDEINRVMKNGRIVCMVVGNRTVKNVWIETDKIIAELFMNKYGYKHLKTIVREIPTKKMPRKNCPSNIKGQTVSTMNNEYIVILEKP